MLTDSNGHAWICKLCKFAFLDRETPLQYIAELRQHAASGSHIRNMQVTIDLIACETYTLT